MLTKNALAKLKRLTQDNLHDDAYVFAAEQLGFQDLMEKFAAIRSRTLSNGELSLDDYHTRGTLYQELKTRAKAALSEKDYNAFYMST